jgi:hypothetical protein
VSAYRLNEASDASRLTCRSSSGRSHDSTVLRRQ